MPASPFASFGLTSAVLVQSLPLVLILIVLGWGVFTLVAAYHLLRYGHQSLLTYLAIILHILISAGIFSIVFASIY